MKITEMSYWLVHNAGRGNFYEGGRSTIGHVDRPSVQYTDYYFIDLRLRRLHQARRGIGER
jgi:hypothetical protein